MSGGSHNYLYGRIEELAYSIARFPLTPRRKAFVRLLCKVSTAAKAIEWVDSGDWAPGDEDKAIDEALGENASALVLAELIEDAKKSIKELQEHIQQHEKQS